MPQSRQETVTPSGTMRTAFVLYRPDVQRRHRHEKLPFQADMLAVPRRDDGLAGDVQVIPAVLCRAWSYVLTRPPWTVFAEILDDIPVADISEREAARVRCFDWSRSGVSPGADLSLYAICKMLCFGL